MRHKLFAVVLSLVLALSMGADAWARAGKGSSLGSRGSRTYDRPIERTTTPPPPSSAPQRPAVEQSPLSQPAQQPMYNPGAVRPQPGMAAPMAPAAQPGFFQRNPMMGGILGGLVGAGIGSMLFGHSPALAAASEASPGASFLGMLLQFALIGGLGWLAYRFFSRRSAQPAPAPAPHADMEYRRDAYAHDVQPSTPVALPPSGAASQPPRRVEKEFEVSAADQETFTKIIAGVQTAWTEGNPVALRQLATPEVVGWMSEDLSRDQSRGVRNVVSDVHLLKGDVTETWRDGELEYATAMITFSAKDYMVRVDDGRVVEGDANNPVEATEAWTFARSPGGRWLLSAIEQV
ncbi:MAG TPA: TIM44-like domain-containing protein [Magnetospirillum sp.]|nr:TIM44-like domain-containing protein [Magnetospirillum sp.]